MDLGLTWRVHAPVCRGVGAGCNTKEVLERLRDLRAEVEDLDLKERELDQQKSWLQQSIRNVMDDAINSRYPFPWLHVTASCEGGVKVQVQLERVSYRCPSSWGG